MKSIYFGRLIFLHLVLSISFLSCRANDLFQFYNNPEVKTVVNAPPADLTITAPAINLANVNSYGVSGTCSVEAATVNVNVGGVLASTACTAGGYATPALIVGGVADNAALPVTVDFTDGASGKLYSAVVNVLKDTVAPAITINAPATVNSANKTAYTVSGTCSENGRLVSVSVGGVAANGTCTLGSYTTNVINVGGLLDNAAVPITADLVDAAGNAAIQAAATAIKDTVSPILTINAPAIINIANVTAYTFSGTCTEAGLNVTVNVGGVISSALCNVSTFSTAAINVGAAPDNAALTITASQTDAAGNVGSQSTPILKDTIAPTVAITAPAIINIANSTAYTFGGGCSENGRVVSVTVGGIAGSGTCNGTSYTTGAINVTTADNPVLPITANLTDAAGNPATTANATVVKDTAAPVIAVTAPAVINAANKTTYTVSGTCTENGQIASVTVGGVAGSGTCNGVSYTTGAINVTAADNPALPITANLSDAAGNPATTASTTVLKDTVLPVVAISTPAIINVNNATAYTVSGTCSDNGVAANGVVVNVTVGGVVSPVPQPTCTPGGTYTTAAMSLGAVADNAAVSITANLTDAAGNLGSISTTVLKDTVAPVILSAETLDTNVPPNGRIDHYRLTLSKPAKDSTFPGYVSGVAPGANLTNWTVAAYCNGTSTFCQFDPTVTGDVANDSVVYIKIPEVGAGFYDTGAKPDITSTSTGLTDAAGNVLVGNNTTKVTTILTADVVEIDKAAPVISSILPATTTTANDSVLISFSEAVSPTGAACAGAPLFGNYFTYNNISASNIDGLSLLISTWINTITCDQAKIGVTVLGVSGNLIAADAASDTIAANTATPFKDMAVNAVVDTTAKPMTRNPYNVTIASITGLAAGETATFANNVTDTISIIQGTTAVPATFALPIIDVNPYSVAITSMPAGKICAIKEKQFGNMAGNINLNVNCAAGYIVGGRYQELSAAPLNYKLYQGKVTAVAGGATGGGTCNGASTTCNDAIGTAAQFYFPQYLAYASGFLYSGDTNNHRIRKINLATNVVTTLAGTGFVGVGTTADDGPCLSAKFNAPNGIVADGTNLYVANYTGNTIQKISDINGTCTVTTLAGGNTATTGLTCGGTTSTTCNDGAGVLAKFASLRQMVLSGNFLYVADSGNHRIRKIDISTGAVTTLAGSGTAADANGTGIAANINKPEGLALIGTTLYTFTILGHLMTIDINTGVATIVAGDGTAGHMDSTGQLSKFNWSPSMTTDGYDLYLVEIYNHTVRRIDVRNNYKTTTLAGFATNSGNVTGIGVNARFNTPHGIVTDGRNLYVANHSNHNIVKLSDNGLVGYWPLDGSANDYSSDSATAPTGTWTGTSAYTAVDRYNVTNNQGGGDFNGTNSISTKDISFGNNAPFAISAWIKPTDLTVNRAIVSKLSFEYFFAVLAGGTLNFMNWDSGGTSKYISSSHAGIIKTNVWTHVAYVYKGAGNGGGRVYVNGHDVTSSHWEQTANPPMDRPENVVIGRGYNLNDFIGSIADVRIYNRALNEGEINELAQDAGGTGMVGQSYNTGATGLLSHYSFDGATNSANAIDSGPLNLAETNMGSTPAFNGKDGDPNGAYVFNGLAQNFVNSAPYGLPLGNQPRTMCGWMNPSALPAINTHAYIAAYGNSVTPALNSAFAIGIYQDDGTNGIAAGTYIVNAIQGSSIAADNLAAASITLNSWSHVCAVYNGTDSILYLNGKQIGSKALSLVTALNSLKTPTLTLGSYTASNELFNGKIDDVRIYNNALTAAQVRELAVQVPTGLVARYDFNGDSTDVSGFGNDLANNGATYNASGGRFGTNDGAYTFANAWLNTTTNLGFPTANGARTICAWFKASGTYGAFNGVVTYGGSATDTIGLNITDSKTASLYLSYGGTTPVTSFSQANTWNMACAVNLGTAPTGSMQFYYNGNLINTATMAASTVMNTTNPILYIGNLGAASNYNPFDGTIDDVRVYNRALTASEIQALVQQPNKRIQVTVSTFDGAMKRSDLTVGTGATGIAKADNWCQTEFGATYKSMIVDGTNRRACTAANCVTGGITENINWVLRPNVTYTRSDGTTPLFTADWNGVWDFAAIPPAWGGSFFNPLTTVRSIAWTGLWNDWRVDISNWHCTSWTGVGTGEAGWSDVQIDTFLNGDGGAACTGIFYSLYCVEQ